jgi:hypothetical protein
MHWLNGLDWLWMSVAMGAWVVLLIVVAYVAVRYAMRPPYPPQRQ